MAGFFAAKDVESLSKLGELMAAPFFGAAAFVSFGYWASQIFPELKPLIIESNIPIAILAKSVAFFISVGLISVIYYAIHNSISARWPVFTYFLGVCLLSFGALGISDVATKAQEHVNVFWYLGALCWGFHIFAPEKTNEIK